MEIIQNPCHISLDSQISLLPRGFSLHLWESPSLTNANHMNSVGLVKKFAFDIPLTGNPSPKRAQEMQDSNIGQQKHCILGDFVSMLCHFPSLSLGHRLLMIRHKEECNSYVHQTNLSMMKCWILFSIGI